MVDERPLKEMATAFKDLANIINSQSTVEVGQFSRACSFISHLISSLGIDPNFMSAELDYMKKVNDLVEASKSIFSLPEMMDADIEANCARTVGSHTRNLLRVKRAIDMSKVLFENVIASDGNSLKDPVSKAYAHVFAPYHVSIIRDAVAAKMDDLPSKGQLFLRLNEVDTSATVLMQEFIASADTVILYVEELFMSRNLDIDW